MLNQIEKQFEGFITAMYRNKTISEAQEKDIERSFYAGMLVSHNMMISFDDNDEIAIEQLKKLSNQISKKADELVNV